MTTRGWATNVLSFHSQMCLLGYQASPTHGGFSTSMLTPTLVQAYPLHSPPDEPSGITVGRGVVHTHCRLIVLNIIFGGPTSFFHLTP